MRSTTRAIIAAAAIVPPYCAIKAAIKTPPLIYLPDFAVRVVASLYFLKNSI